MDTHADVVRWISLVGARPQFIKLAPVCDAIHTHNRSAQRPPIEHLIVHTGQHYDGEMAGLFFEQLHIPQPVANLAVGSGSHGTQLARMVERLESVLQKQSVSWAIVYGDTNSTLAGAIIASRLGLPLAHVEAGCRSYDMRMPEEQNRIVADHLSDLLLAASGTAIQNLRREGIGVDGDPRGRWVVFVGDPMRDALLRNLQLAEPQAKQILREYSITSGGYYLLTLHRAENTDDVGNLGKVLDALSSVDLPVLFPVHPRTRHVLEQSGTFVGSNVRLTRPLGYHEMLTAERHARKILTDSGGVQKEAFYLGVPCVTLRDTTEWPETVTANANRTVGLDVNQMLTCLYAEYPPVIDGDCFGDGHAGERIVAALLEPRSKHFSSAGRAAAGRVA